MEIIILVTVVIGFATAIINAIIAVCKGCSLLSKQNSTKLKEKKERIRSIIELIAHTTWCWFCCAAMQVCCFLLVFIEFFSVKVSLVIVLAASFISSVLFLLPFIYAVVFIINDFEDIFLDFAKDLMKVFQPTNRDNPDKLPENFKIQPDDSV